MLTGPSTDGGFIQWSAEKGSLGRPTDIEAQVVKNRRQLKNSGAYTQVRLQIWKHTSYTIELLRSLSVLIEDTMGFWFDWRVCMLRLEAVQDWPL